MAITSPPLGQDVSMSGGFTSPAWTQWFNDVFTRLDQTKNNIESITTTSGSEIEFTKGINKDFINYRLVIENLKVSSSADLHLVVSSDTGATYIQGTNYEYNNGTDTSTGDAKLLLNSGTLSNADDGFVNGVVTLWTPTETTQATMITWDLFYKDTGSTLQRDRGMGLMKLTDAVDALRFNLSAGTITNSKITLPGLK